MTLMSQEIIALDNEKTTQHNNLAGIQGNLRRLTEEITWLQAWFGETGAGQMGKYNLKKGKKSQVLYMLIMYICGKCKLTITLPKRVTSRTDITDKNTKAQKVGDIFSGVSK